MNVWSHATVLEMVIYGVSFDMVGKTPIVLLKTIAGNRFLPIWIGHPEAASILMRLQGAEPPRPGSHDLMASIIAELGASVDRVTITELRDNTFFAELHIGDTIVLDARPSDALALAVRIEAPIYAAAAVVEEHGIEFEQEQLADKEAMVEEFKSFLEDVSPEDFGPGGN